MELAISVRRAVINSICIGTMHTIPQRLEADILQLLGHRFGEQISKALKEGDIELSMKLSTIYKELREGL